MKEKKRIKQRVLSKYKVKISDVTAWRWLHRLGFSRKHHQKGVYFDGHDRDNVVVNINKFLECMKELDKKTLVPGKACPVLGPNERPLIRVVHDESTYYANCDQSYFWGDNQTNVLKQKSLGSSIMVSDFIDEMCCCPAVVALNRRPGVRCRTSSLVCTSSTHGVQEKGGICLIVLQTADILL